LSDSPEPAQLGLFDRLRARLGRAPAAQPAPPGADSAGREPARRPVSRPPSRLSSRPPLRPRGRSCDLSVLAEEVNQRYFDGELTAAITWGRRRPRKKEGKRRRRSRRVSIQLGSYRADQDLVRIHPALDQPWVPHYVLESIVYHELLHAALPTTVVNGRRRVHTPEFRRRERLYPRLAEAKAWVRDNLMRLIEAG